MYFYSMTSGVSLFINYQQQEQKGQRLSDTATKAWALGTTKMSRQSGPMSCQVNSN